MFLPEKNNTKTPVAFRRYFLRALLFHDGNKYTQRVQTTQNTTPKRKGETLNKDGLAGILQGFLGLLMIKVMSHVSVGTPTDFCQDMNRLSEEHGISTVVFPWDAGTTHLSAQLTRAERLMESTRSQVWPACMGYRCLCVWALGRVLVICHALRDA